jgi:hypothetical protein
MLLSGVDWGLAFHLFPTVVYRTDSLCRGDYRGASGSLTKSPYLHPVPSTGLSVNPNFVVR